MFSAGSLAACTLAAVCAGSPAPAMPTIPKPDPAPSVSASAFALTLQSADGATRTAHLLCRPAGGTHPHAMRACAAVAHARGDFDRLPTEHGLCPMIHAPVQATATGHWRGTPVHHTTTYSNTCAADTGSAGVFGF